MSIRSLKEQIRSLKKANEMMGKDWGMYTNRPGFEMSEDFNFKKIVDKSYICPFSAPFNRAAKPFLRDMYVSMNNEIIKELESKIKSLENE